MDDITKPVVGGFNMVQIVGGIIAMISMVGATMYGALNTFHMVDDADRQHQEIELKMVDGDNRVRDEFQEAIHDQSELLENYNTSFRNERIDRHQEKIREFEYLLRAPETNGRDKQFYEQEIQHSKDMIACIRRNEC